MLLRDARILLQEINDARSVKELLELGDLDPSAHTQAATSQCLRAAAGASEKSNLTESGYCCVLNAILFRSVQKNPCPAIIKSACFEECE